MKKIILKPGLFTVMLMMVNLFFNSTAFSQVANYTFAQSAGTYTPITGGIILGTTANDEEAFNNSTTGSTSSPSSTGFAIGFNFGYNGITYDKFAVSTNGYIVLGTGTFSIFASNSGFTTPLSSGNSGLVSAISAATQDLQGQTLTSSGTRTSGSPTITGVTANTAAPGMTITGTGIPANTQVLTVSGTTITISNNATASGSSTLTFGSTLQYKAVGSTMVIQWAGYKVFNVTGDFFNFQIILTQTSNTVQFVYGTNVASPSSNGSAYSTQVGIRGTVNTDFNNRAVSTAGTWATSTTGAANTDVCRLRNTIVPASGQTYKWTPPPPSSITFSPANPCVGSTLTITGTNLSGATSVTIGGTAAAILTNSSTQITATVGAGTTGTVSVTNYGGTGTSAATCTVAQQPTAAAGGSQAICQTGTATVSGASSSNGTIAWTENGAGSITSGATTLTPVYTPLAADAGNAVTLTMTVSNGNCTAATATYTVNVNGSPTAAAGGSQNVCVNGTGTVSGASSSNGTIAWTENGAGSITSGATTLTPVYTPLAGDASNAVTLTMTVTSNNACAPATASAIYTMNVKALPTAAAGGSQTICQTGTATVSGASSSNGTIAWTENGAGSITSGATTLTPVYTPLAGDAGNAVTLTMTVSNSPCAAVTATYTVNVNGSPTAAAGGSQNICVNGTATVSGASSSNGTIAWTENGAGSITSGATTLTPVYTPLAGDAGNAVTLTMTVTSNNACAPATATANYTVNVRAIPTAAAGGSQTICQTGTATVSGASSSNGTIAWTENGAGSITSGSTSLTPVYTAAAGDAGNTVTLTMTVSNSPCTAATATYTVNVNASNTANAGSAATATQSCSPAAITLSGSGFGGAASSAAWSITSGSGTLSSTAQTATPSAVTFTPTANAVGTVVLTLTTNTLNACPAVTATKNIVVSAPTIVNYDFNNGASYAALNANSATNITSVVSGPAFSIAGTGVASIAANDFTTNATGGSSLQGTVSQASPINWTYTLTGTALSRYKNFKLYYQIQRIANTGGSNPDVTLTYKLNGGANSSTGITATLSANPFTIPSSGTYFEFLSTMPNTVNNPATSLAFDVAFTYPGGGTARVVNIDNFQVQAEYTPISNKTVTAQASSVCSGTGTNIQVALSEIGVSYQLRNNAGNANIGSTVAGTGGTINLPTGNLTNSTTFNVLGSDGTGASCNVQMTNTPTVTVNPLPTITLGANPSVSRSTTAANLSYSATTDIPNQYSIDFDAAAEAQGFVDVVNAALTASPIVITVPATANATTYNGSLTVRNSSTPTCVASGTSISVTVSPVSLSITGISADNKTYDGNNTATLSGTPAYVGLVNGENPAVTGTPSATFNNKNFGTNKPVTMTGYTAPNANYTLPLQPAGLTANIAVRPITVTANTDTKVYDGTTNSAVSPTVPALQGTDAIGTAPSQTFDTRNVGTSKVLTASGLVINDGNSGNNYSISYATNSTGVIQVRNITVSAVTSTKNYDGNTSSAGVPTYTLQPGDATGTAPTQTFDNATVGTGKTLTASGLVINDGNSGNNYNISYATNNTGVINQLAVTITPDAGQFKVFGDADPASFTYTASPSLVSPDVFTGLLSRNAGEALGFYAYTLGTLSAGGNYSLNLGGSNTFEIQAISQSNADFRTKNDGNFTAASIWEYDLGGSNWQNATQAPTSNNNVEVLHNLTLNQDYTIGKNFNIGTGGTVSVNFNRTLSIAATGAADFNGKLVTFESKNAGTASLGQVLGTLTGATNVTVERFIPNNGFRSWRLLSVPTFGSGQTIRQAWQEGNANPLPMQNNIANFGTQITGVFTSQAAAAAAGFDSTSVLAGMLTWNGTNWSNVTTTNTAIANTKAYFLYIRGERSKGVTGAAINASATTLRTNGTVYTGDQVNNIGANSFALVPNLYPSSIDFTGLTRTGGISNLFYVWDSKKQNGNSLGIYQTFSGTNGFNCMISGGSYVLAQPNTTLESGQAFFVQTNNNPGTLTLKENAKISGTNGSLGFRPTAPASSLVKIDTRLYGTGVNNMLDANAVVFDAAYSNAVDGDDAPKFGNPGENLGIQRGTVVLAIEGRQPVTSDDVIQYKMWNMHQQAYSLELVANNMSTQGVSAILEDAYLHTSTTLDLSGTTAVSFTVDANTASSAVNRFRVVFRQLAPVPVNFVSITGHRTNAGVKVDWKSASERGISNYVVERSTDGRNFTAVGKVTAASNNAIEISYNFMDATAPSSALFYRIKSQGVNNEIRYSPIAKINAGVLLAGFVVSPNPVENGRMNLLFKNQEAGKYSVRIISNTGETVMISTINHAGGNGSQLVTLPETMARGTYNVEIVSQGKTKTVQALLLNKK